MSTRPDWRQLTLFDDLEVPITVSIETTLPLSPTLNQVDKVPAIDVSLVRRTGPTRRPDIDGPRLL